MPVAHLNDHEMYYEIHGSGDPLVCVGGWGTYCHGKAIHLPRGLTDHYSVIIFDPRGIGKSTDNTSIPATTRLYAEDIITLLEHLNTGPVHMVGIVGIGACIGQELALMRPDLVRSLINSGTWAKPDSYFEAQLNLLLQVHRDSGFYAFQEMVVQVSFDPVFYNENRHRLLGPHGGWIDLRNNLIAHERFSEASLNHNIIDRLHQIETPTFVVHYGQDLITPPRLSLPVEQNIPGAKGIVIEEAYHVVTGRNLKKRFCEILLDFLSKH
jgi:3-oxoadipate enol-lactonase